MKSYTILLDPNTIEYHWTSGLPVQRLGNKPDFHVSHLGEASSSFSKPNISLRYNPEWMAPHRSQHKNTGPYVSNPLFVPPSWPLSAHHSPAAPRAHWTKIPRRAVPVPCRYNCSFQSLLLRYCAAQRQLRSQTNSAFAPQLNLVFPGVAGQSAGRIRVQYIEAAPLNQAQGPDSMALQ